MIKKGTFLIVVAFLCLIVAIPVTAQETSHVRFGHFVFDEPQVNIFVDGKVYTGEDTTPYVLNPLELSRAYMNVSAGTPHTFAIVEVGKTIDAALFKAEPFTLEAEHNYTLAIMGNVVAKDLHFTLLDETAAIAKYDTKAGAVSFVINNLYGIPAVDFYWGGKLLLENMAYGDYVIAQDDATSVGSRLTPHNDSKTTIFEYADAVAGPPQTIAFFAFAGKFPGTLGEDFTTPYVGNFIGEPVSRDGGSITVGDVTKVSLSEAGLRYDYKLVLDKDMSLDISLAGVPDAYNDALLRVFDDKGKLLVENDDFNHDVGRDAGVKEFKLAKGTYMIEAATYFDTFIGDYTLSISASK